MIVTDYAYVMDIVKKSKGKIIYFTGDLSYQDSKKILFLNSMPYGESVKECCDEPMGYESGEKPIYIPYTTKKGNFGKEGKYPVLLMDADEEGLYSENFNCCSMIYWDTHLVKLLNEQIEKNKVYSCFACDNAKYLIRKEHYEEVIQKYTELVLKIISNYTKFTYKKVKDNLAGSGILTFFQPVDMLLASFLPLLIVNKRLSKKYYDKIQKELVKAIAKFDKIYSNITTFQHLLNNDLHDIIRSQRIHNNILSRYYSVYYDRLSRDELFEIVKYTDIETFMRRVFPKLNLTKEELLDDKNEAIKKYLESRIKRIIDIAVPVPKLWGKLNYKVEIEDIDSTLLMAVLNSNDYDFAEGQDLCGC